MPSGLTNHLVGLDAGEVHPGDASHLLTKLGSDLIGLANVLLAVVHHHGKDLAGRPIREPIPTLKSGKLPGSGMTVSLRLAMPSSIWAGSPSPKVTRANFAICDFLSDWHG